jgi:NitT/TauT family transport system ATP-binding protein
MNAPASHAGPAIQNAATVIEAAGLGLTFATNDGPVEALSNVDLAIDRGEFVSFIGPSGCASSPIWSSRRKGRSSSTA